MAEKKEKTYPSQLDKVKEITDQLEAGLEKLFDSDAFKQYLTTLSKFHDYSLNNTLLIAMQKPDATLVAGYTAWQKQFGRQVMKGAKALPTKSYYVEGGFSHLIHMTAAHLW